MQRMQKYVAKHPAARLNIWNWEFALAFYIYVEAFGT